MPSAGTIFRSWFDDVWNQGKAEHIGRYLSRDVVMHALDMNGADVRGPEGFQAFFEHLLENFSNIHFTVHEVVEEGDRAAGRWTARLTHSGDGFGAPATGETVNISGMSMIRVADGQVVEAWDEWDRLRLATACRMLTPV